VLVAANAGVTVAVGLPPACPADDEVAAAASDCGIVAGFAAANGGGTSSRTPWRSSCLSRAALRASDWTPNEEGAAAAGVADGAAGVATVAGGSVAMLEVDSVTPSGVTIGSARDAPPPPPPLPPDGGSDARLDAGATLAADGGKDASGAGDGGARVDAGDGCTDDDGVAALLKSMASSVFGSTIVRARRSRLGGGAGWDGATLCGAIP